MLIHANVDAGLGQEAAHMQVALVEGQRRVKLLVGFPKGPPSMFLQKKRLK